MSAPAYPVARYCRCGRLDTSHKIRGNGTRGGTDDAVCRAYWEARTVEMVPESVLRARLEAVLALPGSPPRFPDNLVGPAAKEAYEQGWNDARAFAKRAARGETP